MSRKKSILIQILMPILITALCGGVIFLLSIKPYEKASTYFHTVFMDNKAVIPESDGITELNIVQTDVETEFEGKTYENGQVVYPEYGTQYAVLECDALDIYVPIYWGNGSELLNLGGCNTPSSVPAGAEGNTVISAHVNTFFSNLSEITAGEKVTVYTDYGRFTYTVSELIEFDSADKSYISHKDENILTLYTCESNLLSASSKRIGCICTLEKKEFYTEMKEAENEE